MRVESVSIPEAVVVGESESICRAPSPEAVVAVEKSSSLLSIHEAVMVECDL